MYAIALGIKLLSELVTAIFLCAFLTPRGKKYLPMIIYPVAQIAILAIMGAFALVSTRDPSMLRTLITLGCMLALVMLLFKEKWTTKLFYMGIALGLQVLSELSSSLPAALLDPEKISYGSGNGGNTEITIAYIKLCALFFIIYSLFAVLAAIIIKKLKHDLNTEGVTYFAFFPLTQFVLLMVLYIKSAEDVALGSALIWVGLAVLCVVADLGVYKALTDITKKARLEETARLYKQQLEMQLAHYKAFSSYNESLSHIRHDLSNQAMVIQKLIYDRDYDEAGKMMSQIQEKVKDLKGISFCEDKVVNALIFSKKQEMDESGITFESKLNIPEDLPIKAIDFCSIFSNILDNAIAATKEVSENPYIKLESIVSKNYLLIRSENSISGELKLDKNGFPVSPRVDEGHGNGNKILMELAEKYHGEMNIDLSVPDIFRATISLQI